MEIRTPLKIGFELSIWICVCLDGLRGEHDVGRPLGAVAQPDGIDVEDQHKSMSIFQVCKSDLKSHWGNRGTNKWPLIHASWLRVHTDSFYSLQAGGSCRPPPHPLGGTYTHTLPRPPQWLSLPLVEWEWTTTQSLPPIPLDYKQT